MFFGQYEHTIDEKGRLTIPARFREDLAEGTYITLGFDNNLMCMSKHNLEVLSHKLRTHNIMDPFARKLRRMFYSYGVLIESDKMGRILIPQNLREMVNLDQNVVITGSGDYFEIWSASQWNSESDQLQKSDLKDKKLEYLDLTFEEP
ncbi:MAG TPA: division/cell wall cluster transcriptional repressor MraZ [Anaerolineaceae bacterium]|jgi:MraZ protein|nr:division/cell wall cluster transcriptional repressor MraZ [Anaerolineaceae bacterium]